MCPDFTIDFFQEASSLGDFVARFELCPVPSRPPVAQLGRHLHLGVHLHLPIEAAQKESVPEEAVAPLIHQIHLKRDKSPSAVAVAAAVAVLTISPAKKSQEES